jgi:hypothetical protein
VALPLVGQQLVVGHGGQPGPGHLGHRRPPFRNLSVDNGVEVASAVPFSLSQPGV